MHGLSRLKRSQLGGIGRQELRSGSGECLHRAQGALVATCRFFLLLLLALPTMLFPPLMIPLPIKAIQFSQRLPSMTGRPRPAGCRHGCQRQGRDGGVPTICAADLVRRVHVSAVRDQRLHDWEGGVAGGQGQRCHTHVLRIRIHSRVQQERDHVSWEQIGAVLLSNVPHQGGLDIPFDGAGARCRAAADRDDVLDVLARSRWLRSRACQAGRVEASRGGRGG
mmetsp:Transcript_36942/g.120136  ORF Transcript_36942/g.120136 Transcript_36942/m.120136 type:complete len:223 (-) Transcript_36942:555-1223(-)